jgi:putative addiction module killer protein
MAKRYRDRRGPRTASRPCRRVAEKLQTAPLPADGPIRIEMYRTPDGRIPFRQWLARLHDEVAERRIVGRVKRLELGNRGDWKSVGGGVLELRIPHGPGYRVYFGWNGPRVVLLLCGGDKSSQSRDIGEAHAFWKDYKNGLR